MLVEQWSIYFLEPKLTAAINAVWPSGVYCYKTNDFVIYLLYKDVVVIDQGSW
jgi:hypothetical protein